MFRMSDKEWAIGMQSEGGRWGATEEDEMNGMVVLFKSKWNEIKAFLGVEGPSNPTRTPSLAVAHTEQAI